MIFSRVKKSRRRGLRRRGRGAWKNDNPPIFILVEKDGCKDYLPSTDVEEETVQKGVGRKVSECSKVYTDSFKSYSCLGEVGYTHESVNHSEGEWVRGE